MANSPSKSIKVIDLVGAAIDVVNAHEARILNESMRIVYYNQAMQELYTFINVIDNESYLDTQTLTLGAGVAAYHRIGDMSADTNFDDYDRVSYVEITNDAAYIDVYKIPLAEFERYRVQGSVLYPYANSIIYTEIGGKLHVLIGTDITVGTLVCNVVFRRQATLVSSSDYSSAYMDLANKYYPLILNKIASIIERKIGVTEKSLAMLQANFQQLSMGLDSAARSAIMETLEYPKRELDGLQNNNTANITELRGR